jgi:hypothetical protein
VYSFEVGDAIDVMHPILNEWKFGYVIDINNEAKTIKIHLKNESYKNDLEISYSNF